MSYQRPTENGHFSIVCEDDGHAVIVPTSHHSNGTDTGLRFLLRDGDPVDVQNALVLRRALDTYLAANTQVAPQPPTLPPALAAVFDDETPAPAREPADPLLDNLATVTEGERKGDTVCVVSVGADGLCRCDIGQNAAGEQEYATIPRAALRPWVSVKSVSVRGVVVAAEAGGPAAG